MYVLGEQSWRKEVSQSVLVMLNGWQAGQLEYESLLIELNSLESQQSLPK